MQYFWDLSESFGQFQSGPLKCVYIYIITLSIFVFNSCICLSAGSIEAVRFDVLTSVLVRFK